MGRREPHFHDVLEPVIPPPFPYSTGRVLQWLSIGLCGNCNFYEPENVTLLVSRGPELSGNFLRSNFLESNRVVTSGKRRFKWFKVLLRGWMQFVCRNVEKSLEKQRYAKNILVISSKFMSCQLVLHASGPITVKLCFEAQLVNSKSVETKINLDLFHS